MQTTRWCQEMLFCSNASGNTHSVWIVNAFHTVEYCENVLSTFKLYLTMGWITPLNIVPLESIQSPWLFPNVVTLMLYPGPRGTKTPPLCDTNRGTIHPAPPNMTWEGETGSSGEEKHEIKGQAPPIWTLLQLQLPPVLYRPATSLLLSPLPGPCILTWWQ